MIDDEKPPRRAVKPGKLGAAPKTFEPDRQCPECGTYLSSYSRGPYCSRHGYLNPVRFPRVRGAVRRDTTREDENDAHTST